MDYKKFKRTPEERKKARIRKKLVKYINGTHISELSIEELAKIMRGD